MIGLFRRWTEHRRTSPPHQAGGNLGFLATLGLGLVGSLIGGLIAQLFGTGSIWELNILGFILAVASAVLLIGVAERVAGKGQHD